jgi:Carboxypeptidase regulatory-like domain
LRTTLAGVGLLFLSGTVLFAQSGAAVKGGTIEGVVTRSGTGEPLHDVLVTATGVSGQKRAVTDEKGRFLLADLASGAYSLEASAMLFVRARKNGLNVAPDQRLGVDVQLTPTAVIAGRVYDQNQHPLAAVRVEALRYQYRDGTQVLVLAGTGHSDDRGEYRVYNLQPGAYYVRAVPSPASPQSALAPVYYPGALDAQDGILIKTAPGTESNAIDIRLGDNRTFRVRLAIAAPNAVGASFSAIRVDRSVPESIVLQQQSLGSGVYQLSPLAPGSYEIFARVQSRLSASQIGILTGRTAVNIGDQDVDAGTLAVRLAEPLKGRFIVSEPLSSPLDPARIQVDVHPMAGLPSFFSTGSRDPGGAISRDGAVTIPDVANGRFRIEVSGLPDNVYLISARHGGTEAIDGGINFDGTASGALDLYLGGPASVGTIEGTVRNQDGRPVGSSVVVIVPAPNRRHNPAAFRTEVTDQVGAFSVRGLLPGEYTVLAWDDVEASVYENPESLKDVEHRGVRATVERGTRNVVDVRVIP